jgi:hypothetical protein
MQRLAVNLMALEGKCLVSTVQLQLLPVGSVSVAESFTFV